MKNLKIQHLSILIALLILMLSTACTPQTPPEPTATSAEAAAAQEEIAVDERADWPEVFKMGYFAQDDAEAVLQTNESLRLHMEEALGIPVELFTGTNYTAVIEAMRAKRVDAMEVGPFSYILAVQEAQAEALAASVSTKADPPVYDPALPPHYYSIIFTKKGSGLETLQDLKGVDFTFVDPASTSGHLAPKTLLVKNGLDPDNDMNTVFAGSHPTSVIAIWNDKAQAGATYELNLYNLQAEGQIDFCGFPDGQPGLARTPEQIKELYDNCPEGHIAIIAMSDPIPSTPFAIRSDLPQSFKDAVQAALLDVKNQPEIISETKRWYVDPSEELGLERLDQYYNSLRDIAKLLDLDLKELEN